MTDQPCPDRLHYHKRTEPEAGMGPHCGAECCYCARDFSPDAVADDCVRFGDDCGSVSADGWACRGCMALMLISDLREQAGDYEALQELLEGEWP